MADLESEVIETLEILTAELGIVPQANEFMKWAFVFKTPIASPDTVSLVTDADRYHSAVRELGFESDTPPFSGNGGISFYVNNGYEQIYCGPGVGENVPHHRLLAVAEYGLDEIAGKDIHHKNNIPWDNRPENIKPMSPSEHRSHHAKLRAK